MNGREVLTPGQGFMYHWCMDPYSLGAMILYALLSLVAFGYLFRRLLAVERELRDLKGIVEYQASKISHITVARTTGRYHG